MALNTKGKKTSLTEEASIYQKRQDDLSDKERIKNMTGKQKRDFFKTRKFWVVFSKYGEYNGKKPGCGIQNQINSGRKY